MVALKFRGDIPHIVTSNYNSSASNLRLELHVLDFAAAHLRRIKCVLRLILSRRFAII